MRYLIVISQFNLWRRILIIKKWDTAFSIGRIVVIYDTRLAYRKKYSIKLLNSLMEGYKKDPPKKIDMLEDYIQELVRLEGGEFIRYEIKSRDI